MMLHLLTQRVDRLPDFDALLITLQAPHGRGHVVGLSGAARALFLARLHQRLGGQMLLVAYQNEQAQRLWDDLHAFGIPESRLFLLPASESHWLSHDAADYRALSERIAALTALGTGVPCIVIGTAEAIFQRTCPPEDLLAPALSLAVGQTIDLESLLRSLVQMGYDAETTVSRPGQFSRRGGILDIFPSASESPVRLELFGDEIESLRAFDVTTQRSAGAVPQITIYPVRELVLTPSGIQAAVPSIRKALDQRKRQLFAEKNRAGLNALHERVENDLVRLQNGVYFDGVEEYLPYFTPEPVCAIDYLRNPADASHPPPLIVVDEPAQVRAHWERLRAEIGDARERRAARGELIQGASHPTISAERLESLLHGGAEAHAILALTQLSRPPEGFQCQTRLQVSAAAMESYRSRLPFFADEVQTWLANGAECLIVSDQPQRVREICRELTLPVSEEETLPAEKPTEQQPLRVLEGRLRQGFKFADIGLYVATDAELFGSARPTVARRRAAAGIPLSTILDLREGDYVVHIHHGIGVYRGMTKRQVDGAERDYLHIQYAGADRLFVPADQIDRVQRYIGGEGSPPPINRIGGNEWQRTTRRVKEQARIMAKELIELYAARQAAERPSYGEDTPWQAEMEEAFPYDETPSQWRAILDVKQNLQESRPMDRLICGDVGFGKTEVAIRAAFKVVESGKQVAVLCPTTVLAAQHYTTFSERLAAYPIRVELLSRFRSRQEQKKTVERLKSGEADIVVGTHRLLSKDVEFASLGLLIVDEEQRFGVAQKERLKQLRKTVDVLTLTATPIPRTLSMALAGLRDMSVIEDPPSGRVPIITSVREYDDDLVRDAILRELERDGQVYFVHNRVETIAYIAQRIQRLVPDARIRIGHGQMSEDELEKIMLDFYHREYDVLLCTTIIENGLDIPNVNTIIVDNADRMGLAQLYQLRGRVGRSNRQAYAYLLYRPNKQLTEEAQQRLMAIREFTALGSGYQVAMRDLEIRGAGNLLGAEQSGAMISVGFDLYCELLSQAVAEIKGEEPADVTLPPVDLPVTAHIPGEYIPNEAERIFFYKKMSGVRSRQDIEDLLAELEDRYGDPPRSVWNALEVLRLRLRAKEAGIAAIRGEKREVTLRFAPHVRLTPEALRLLTHVFRHHRFTADSVVIGLTSPQVIREVEEMLDILERALKEGKRIVKDAIVR